MWYISPREKKTGHTSGQNHILNYPKPKNVLGSIFYGKQFLLNLPWSKITQPPFPSLTTKITQPSWINGTNFCSNPLGDKPAGPKNKTNASFESSESSKHRPKTDHNAHASQISELSTSGGTDHGGRVSRTQGEVSRDHLLGPRVLRLGFEI